MEGTWRHETFDFEEVYDTYFERLFLYALKLTRSKEVAKDVVSDVFMVCWQSQPNFHNVRNLQAYLFKSVKNRALRYLAKDSVLVHDDDFSETLGRVESVTPENILFERELSKGIHEVVQNLPERCRLVFEMARVEHMSHQAISDELGISIITVRNQVAKALRRIRAHISAHYRQDNGSNPYYKYVSGLLIALAFLSSV